MGYERCELFVGYSTAYSMHTNVLWTLRNETKIKVR